MPNPGQELASIDFAAMIGGPLIAVVRAQAQAANTTVDFIKSVGFKKPDEEADPLEDTETKEPIYVKFKFWKETQPFQPATPGDPSATPPVLPTPEIPAKFELQYLEVPVITLFPIPHLRVEETTIEFNAKINSITFEKTDTNVKVTTDFEAKAGWFFGSAKLNVSASYQKETKAGFEYKQAYSLKVHVHAVQEEMPAGMEKVLGLLETSIAAPPVRPPVTR